MDFAAFSQTMTHLLLGAFSTFCAILLWSRTRDMAWTFVIIGAIVSYADVALATLRSFGILGEDLIRYRGIPVLQLALASIPPLFSGVGFLIAAAKRGRS